MKSHAFACIVASIAAIFFSGLFYFMGRHHSTWREFADREAALWRRIMPTRFVDLGNQFEKSRYFAILIGVFAILFAFIALSHSILYIWPNLIKVH